MVIANQNNASATAGCDHAPVRHLNPAATAAKRKLSKMQTVPMAPRFEFRAKKHATYGERNPELTSQPSEKPMSDTYKVLIATILYYGALV